MNFEINNAVFNKFPKLESKNLLFSEITNTHAESFFKMRSDTEVVKYMDTFPHKSIEQTIKLIELYQQSFFEHNAINWFILKKNTKEFVGYVGFWRMFREHCRAEIGYSLGREYWGKGIMQEALPMIIDFGFNSLNLHSIEAAVNPLNIKSIKLLGKYGFIKEAYYKENFLFDKQYLDTEIYSLLESN